jgi:hypothetical protein
MASEGPRVGLLPISSHMKDRARVADAGVETVGQVG